MSKFVIISGSPRKGNSDDIAEFIKNSIDGEVELFNIINKDVCFCIKDDAYDLINTLNECD